MNLCYSHAHLRSAYLYRIYMPPWHCPTPLAIHPPEVLVVFLRDLGTAVIRPWDLAWVNHEETIHEETFSTWINWCLWHTDYFIKFMWTVWCIKKHGIITWVMVLPPSTSKTTDMTSMCMQWIFKYVSNTWQATDKMLRNAAIYYYIELWCWLGGGASLQNHIVDVRTW